MRKRGGTPSRPGTLLMLAASSPPGVPRGRFVAGHQLGIAGCKTPSLFMRRASSSTVTRVMPRGTMGPLSTTQCTYLPTIVTEGPFGVFDRHYSTNFCNSCMQRSI